TAFQKRTPVKAHSTPERRRVALGNSHIERHKVHLRTREVEGERVERGRPQASRFLAQSTAQVLQALPQAGEGSVFRALGPESPCQPRSLDRGALPQSKQCEQPLHLTGAQAPQRRTVDVRCERAKQPQDEWRCRRFLHNHNPWLDLSESLWAKI